MEPTTKALKRTNDQPDDQIALAKSALGWLTHAQRLLSITELLHAVAIESDEKEFDEDNLSDLETVLSVCAGLVIADKTSDIIRLVHYTTQEFFVRNDQNVLPNAKQDIVVSCLTYLLYESFPGCITDDDELVNSHHVQVGADDVDQIKQNESERDDHDEINSNTDSSARSEHEEEDEDNNPHNGVDIEKHIQRSPSQKYIDDPCHVMNTKNSFSVIVS